MSTPTQNCDECEHFAFYDGPNCAKGHNPRFYKPTIAVDVKAWGYKRKCEDFESMKEKETMSTPFKSEWLQPGAVVPADIPTLGAFADELRRVMLENEELRKALVQAMNLYKTAAIHRDQLFEKLIEQQEGTVMAEYKFQTYAAYKKDGEMKIGVVPEPEQEPVAWRWKERINGDFDNWVVTSSEPPPYATEKQPLYTTPSRKPLTHPQIHELDWPDGVAFDEILLFVRAIEAAHQIGVKK